MVTWTPTKTQRKIGTTLWGIVVAITVLNYTVLNYSVFEQLSNMLTLGMAIFIFIAPIVKVPPPVKLKTIIAWAHEQLHALFMRLFGGTVHFDWQGIPSDVSAFARVKFIFPFVFWLASKLGGAHVSSDHPFTRWQFIVITLSPSLLLVPFAVAGWSGVSMITMLLLMLIYLGSMIADFITAFYVLMLPADVRILDDGLSIRWWRESA